MANLLVLYGSQSGTAEDVAERIAREGYLQKFSPSVACMNDIDISTIVSNWNSPQRPVIFIAATTGQGDPPDNMKIFWRNLCRAYWSLGVMNKMNYAVIALGDSSYEKYNFVGKKLFKRLQQLGANPLLEVCLGDDQHDLGYHAAVNPWLEKLWSTIKATDENNTDEIDQDAMSKFLITHSVAEGANQQRSLNDEYPADMKMEMREVTGNRRVTSENHWQDTRLITISLKESALKYAPGDVLCVQPPNLPENVETFFQIFPDLLTALPIYVNKNPIFQWSRISPEIRKVMGCQPWTWKKIVTHMLDIQSVPRLYFFEVMCRFATNPLEKERLKEFCSPTGQEDLFAYCNRPKRNILEVFGDFPHTTREIPPVYLFDLIPAIKPRSFSIASSPSAHPGIVQILVAVVEYQTKIKEKRKGLCSNWLAHHCPINTLIPVWTQKGSFSFPLPQEDTTVIMIGPGTGIAPFRSVIMENQQSWNKWLFFGCRNKNSDFYFAKEWRQLESEKSLKFYTAFSRQSDTREYVQDVILRESVTLGRALEAKNFYIYVAGNAKQMPKDVNAALVKVMEEAGIPDAESYIEQCSKKLGRYQTETWS